jgi:hypothetical protein
MQNAAGLSPLCAATGSYSNDLVLGLQATRLAPLQRILSFVVFHSGCGTVSQLAEYLDRQTTKTLQREVAKKKLQRTKYCIRNKSQPP